MSVSASTVSLTSPEFTIRMSRRCWQKSWFQGVYYDAYEWDVCAVRKMTVGYDEMTPEKMQSIFEWLKSLVEVPPNARDFLFEAFGEDFSASAELRIALDRTEHWQPVRLCDDSKPF